MHQGQGQGFWPLGPRPRTNITGWEQRTWVSDDEATPLFDMHKQPVHCPVERCKLHRQCFGWLAVTPLVNEILSKFIITVHIYRAR